jgi:hypothetical protein
VLAALFVGVACSGDEAQNPSSNSNGTGGSGNGGDTGSGGRASGTGGTASVSGSGGSGAAGGGGGTGGAGGSPPPNGPPGVALVNAGNRVSSANYSMVFTLGQSTQNQGATTSRSYRMQGGLIGANGSLP